MTNGFAIGSVEVLIQHLRIFGDQIALATQHFTALSSVHFRPGARFQCTAGSRNRMLNLDLARNRGGCPDFTRSWIDRLQLPSILGIAPLTIDVHLVTFQSMYTW